MKILNILVLLSFSLFMGCSSHGAGSKAGTCPYKKLKAACEEGCEKSCKKLKHWKKKSCSKADEATCKDCKGCEQCKDAKGTCEDCKDCKHCKKCKQGSGCKECKTGTKKAGQNMDKDCPCPECDSDRDCKNCKQCSKESLPE